MMANILDVFKPNYGQPQPAQPVVPPVRKPLPMGPPVSPIDRVAVAKAAGYPTEREKYQVPGLAPAAASSTILGRPANTSRFSQAVDKVRPTVALADVAVPGSQTASADPVIARPTQSGPVQRAPATNMGRSSYQMDDAAKDFTMMPDEGQATSTAFDSKGNYMQGINKSGGTFNVMRGDRGGATDAEWEAMNQDERSAIRVASIEDASAKNQQARVDAQVKAYQSGTGPLTLAQQFASDMNDYNSGRVGSEGYKRMRSMRMRSESAARDLPRGRARNEALAEIAVNPLGATVAVGEKDAPALSPTTQLGMARLNWDTHFKAQEAQRKAMNDQYTRQRDEYQTARDSAKDARELRAASRERADEIITDGSRFAPELQQVGPQLLRQSVNKNMDVDSAADAMNALLAEDTPAMIETRKSLLDDDEETQRAAQRTFAEMFARKQGWDQ